MMLIHHLAPAIRKTGGRERGVTGGEEEIIIFVEGAEVEKRRAEERKTGEMRGRRGEDDRRKEDDKRNVEEKRMTVEIRKRRG